jgi:cell division protein FtsL
VIEADIKRLEQEQQHPQIKAKSQSGYTKKDKILVFSIVAGLVVLAVVLAFTTKKGGHAFCDVDPADPDCIGSR